MNKSIICIPSRYQWKKHDDSPRPQSGPLNPKKQWQVPETQSPFPKQLLGQSSIESARRSNQELPWVMPLKKKTTFLPLILSLYGLIIIAFPADSDKTPTSIPSTFSILLREHFWDLLAFLAKWKNSLKEWTCFDQLCVDRRLHAECQAVLGVCKFD